MKTEFTPIAMRCTEENWNSISHKIRNAGIRENVWGLDDKQCYLCNNWAESKKDGKIYIGNHSNEHSNFSSVSKVYETWDETIFLKACGIEVDTYTVSKDFILEAHKDACSTWKTKIENQFPELFPKVELEVGKWYVAYWCDFKYIVCVESIEQDINTHGFNITENGRYTDLPFSIDYDYKWTLATKEEVETALIAEAKKRGFKEGVRFNNACNGTVHTKNSGTVNHKISYMVDSDSDIDGLHSNNQWIFFNGKWAEIISEPIELSLDEIAEKFGVDVSLIKIKK